jgi:hypothetical protein
MVTKMRKSVSFTLFLNLVISTVISTSLAVLSSEVVVANTTNKPSLWARIYQNLLNKKPPVKPRNAGSRPQSVVCMISPDAPGMYRTIWSDRPFFLWQGQVNNMEVSSINKNEKLWIYSPHQTQQNITYTGEPLQPGEAYKWVVNMNQFVPFQIMEQQERNLISAELENIEKQLQSKGANPEEIASAKANYFADHNLWSDVLQAIYSVAEPSPELSVLQQDIINKLCQPKQPEQQN